MTAPSLSQTASSIILPRCGQFMLFLWISDTMASAKNWVKRAFESVNRSFLRLGSPLILF